MAKGVTGRPANGSVHVRVICPGWFGNDHGPLVINEAANEEQVSHGMCPACWQLAEAAIEEADRTVVLETLSDAERALDAAVRAAAALHPVRFVPR